MIRGLRQAHRWAWRILAVLVPLGLAAALYARPDWPREPRAVVELSNPGGAEGAP